MTVTEGCSAADVFSPSMISSFIAKLSHEKLLRSSPSRDVEAHLVIAIYKHFISLLLGRYLAYTLVHDWSAARTRHPLAYFLYCSIFNLRKGKTGLTDVRTN